MKRVFTKNQILKLTGILAFALGSTGVFAQGGEVVVNSPASMAGVKYYALNAAFGNHDEFTGEIATIDDGTGDVTDGCESFSGLDGKIAIIDRGACAFTVKCENAASAGAVAVVVCNNADEVTPGNSMPIRMTGTSAVEIPCYMMSKQDCAAMLVEVDNGVNITMKPLSDCDLSGITYPDNAIWGTVSGEGDFADGLNGWESSKDEDKGWQWSADGDLTRGTWNSRVPNINSVTSCNGAIVFDSDFYDTGGNGTTGTCPAPCIGAIYSPVIDLSGRGASDLYLQFTQNTRQYSSTYSVVHSSDGGTTWDTIAINRDIKLNSNAYRGDIVKVPLCGSDPSSTEFKFGFLYSGNYYYWAIDDVMLLDESRSSIDIAQTWFAGAPDFYVPESQLEGKKIPFMTDVRHQGNITVTGVSIKAEVADPDGAIVGTSVLAYDDQVGCTTDENRVFPDIFDMGASHKIGRHTITYTLNSDNDDTPDNNVLKTEYYVTENVFSKAPTEAEVGFNYMSSFGFPWDGMGIYYNMGNIYYMPNGSAFQNQPGQEYSITFGVTGEGEAFSGYVTASLYKWENKSDPVNDNGVPIITVESDERIQLSIGEAVFVNTETDNRLISVVFEEEEYEGSLNLEDDSYYLVSIDVAPDSGSDNIYMLAADRDVSPAFHYAPVKSAGDQVEINNSPAFYATGSEGDVDERAFTTLGSTRIAVIPLTVKITSPSGTEDINTDIKVSISPNPASEYLGISLDLNAISKNVNVELVSIDGKVVATQDFSNVKSETLNIDVTSIATGVYMANIRTAEGFVSKRVVVQK